MALQAGNSPVMLLSRGLEEEEAAHFNTKYEVVGEARQFEKVIRVNLAQQATPISLSPSPD